MFARAAPPFFFYRLLELLHVTPRTELLKE